MAVCMTGIPYRLCLLILGMQQSVTFGRLGKTCTLYENEQINEKVKNKFALFFIFMCSNLTFSYTERKRNRICFFDPCLNVNIKLNSLWTHLEQCHFRFRFRIHINEPLPLRRIYVSCFYRCRHARLASLLTKLRNLMCSESKLTLSPERTHPLALTTTSIGDIKVNKVSTVILC